MRFLRRVSLLAACVFLAGCGFSPVYGSHGNGGATTADALANVFIENITGRDGQFMRNHLIDRLYIHGRPAQPEAKLSVSVATTESDLGIQKDATASRSEISVTATYSLFDLDGKKLISGSAHSVVGYGKLDAQYANVAGQRNATDRALTEVSEQIVNRLSAYYTNKEEGNATPPAEPEKKAPEQPASETWIHRP